MTPGLPAIGGGCSTLFGVTEANWRDAAKRDPHFTESETPLYVGRGIAALAADPNHWRASGQALTSWDLAEKYNIEDADGRRPHWGRYIAGQVDILWSGLVAEARRQLAERAPGVEVEEDRASLTLRAGGVSRAVLEPELFMIAHERIADELVARYARAVSGAG